MSLPPLPTFCLKQTKKIQILSLENFETQNKRGSHCEMARRLTPRDKPVFLKAGGTQRAFNYAVYLSLGQRKSFQEISHVKTGFKGFKSKNQSKWRLAKKKKKKN